MLENNLSVLLIWLTVGSGFSREERNQQKDHWETNKRSDVSFVADTVSWFHRSHPFSLWTKNPISLWSQFSLQDESCWVSPAQPSHSSLIGLSQPPLHPNSVSQWDKTQSPLGKGKGKWFWEDIFPSSKMKMATKWCDVILWHLYPLKIRFLLLPFYQLYYLMFGFVLVVISFCVNSLSLSLLGDKLREWWDS